jgi:hypothetical protein
MKRCKHDATSVDLVRHGDGWWYVYLQDGDDWYFGRFGARGEEMAARFREWATAIEEQDPVYAGGGPIGHG